MGMCIWVYFKIVYSYIYFFSVSLELFLYVCLNVGVMFFFIVKKREIKKVL